MERPPDKAPAPQIVRHFARQDGGDTGTICPYMSGSMFGGQVVEVPRSALQPGGIQVLPSSVMVIACQGDLCQLWWKCAAPGSGKLKS